MEQPDGTKSNPERQSLCGRLGKPKNNKRVRQFLKAEPSWTPWKGQNKRQSLRGHLGRTKKKSMAFMDNLGRPKCQVEPSMLR